MKRSLLLLLVSFSSAFASQPGTPPPFDSFVPSGGGYKGAAKIFPVSLDNDDCDQGFILKLVKSPGLVQRYRLFLQETYRGTCTKTALSTELEFINVEVDRSPSRVLFKSTQGARLITLSDRRGIKTDQPAWVALIDGVYYQSTSVAEADLP